MRPIFDTVKPSSFAIATECPDLGSQGFQRLIKTTYIERGSSPPHLSKTKYPNKECPELTGLLITGHSHW